MPPRRRPKQKKPLPRKAPTTSSRIVTIGDEDQLRHVLDRTSARKLVVLLYGTASQPSLTNLARQLLIKLSREAQLRHVTFAFCNIDSMPGAGAELRAGEQAPIFHLRQEGQTKEVLPAENSLTLANKYPRLVQLCEDLAGQPPGRGLWERLALGAAVVVAAGWAGWKMVQQQQEQQIGTSAYLKYLRKQIKNLDRRAKEFETRMLKAKTKKDKGIAKREHDRLRAKATELRIDYRDLRE